MPSYDCPTCGRRFSEPTLEQAPFRPFCCRRCKLIDLSKWFHEEYRIEAPLQIPSTGEEDTEKLP